VIGGDFLFGQTPCALRVPVVVIGVTPLMMFSVVGISVVAVLMF